LRPWAFPPKNIDPGDRLQNPEPFLFEILKPQNAAMPDGEPIELRFF
jgi:hypothetical protein